MCSSDLFANAESRWPQLFPTKILFVWHVWNPRSLTTQVDCYLTCTSLWDHYYLMYSWMISVRFLIGLSPSCLLTTWNCTGMFCRTWMSGALQVDLMVLNKKTNYNGLQLNLVKCKMITSKPRCLTEVNTLLMMLYLKMLNSGVILEYCLQRSNIYRTHTHNPTFCTLRCRGNWGQ